MLKASIKKNDKLARILILTLSVIVFVVVVITSRMQVDLELGFDKHLFAQINAVINSMVTVLLAAALVAVKMKKYEAHKKIMLCSIVLSTLFLVSYICHHVLSGDTKFGGQGAIRTFYYIILITHIILAAIILPFILFTAYRGLTGEYANHKKLARITWPIWFYVAMSGVIVYLMISPYYT